MAIMDRGAAGQQGNTGRWNAKVAVGGRWRGLCNKQPATIRGCAMKRGCAVGLLAGWLAGSRQILDFRF